MRTGSFARPATNPWTLNTHGGSRIAPIKSMTPGTWKDNAVAPLLCPGGQLGSFALVLSDSRGDRLPGGPSRDPMGGPTVSERLGPAGSGN